MSRQSLLPPGVNINAVKPAPFDPRDHYYTPQITTVHESVNLRQDDAKYFSTIYDQGSMGSCTANATAAAFWYEEKLSNRAAVWDPAGPSRLFIYWLARGGYNEDSHDIKGVKDDGSFARDAMKGIDKAGVCPEKDCAYVDYEAIKAALGQVSTEMLDHEVKKQANRIINKKPSDQAFTDALQHKITAYYRLDPDRPEDDDAKLSPEQKTAVGVKTLENLRYCLAEEFPVVFSFWFYEDARYIFDTDEDTGVLVLRDVWHRKNDPIPPNTKAPPKADGHSVLAIGYDDRRQQVLIQNSWGSDWGVNGTFWMPYAYITDFYATFDFWTIRKDRIPAKPQAPTTWQTLQAEIEAASSS